MKRIRRTQRPTGDRPRLDPHAAAPTETAPEDDGTASVSAAPAELSSAAPGSTGRRRISPHAKGSPESGTDRKRVNPHGTAPPEAVAAPRKRVDPHAARPDREGVSPHPEASSEAASGRKRVNPHAAQPEAESNAGATRPRRFDPSKSQASGRTRIDRSALQPDAEAVVETRRRVSPHGTAPVRAARRNPAEDVVRIEAPKGVILVASFADEPWSEAEAELLGAARGLADSQADTAVLLVRFDQVAAACDAASNGVDRLISLMADGRPDRAAAVLADLVEQYQPRHLVFADAPVDGDIARRLAAILGERPATAVQRLRGGEVTCRTDGGRQDMTRPIPRMVLLASGTGEPLQSAPRREARVLPAPTVSEGDLIDLGPEPMDPSAVPLDQARFIVSAGDGVTDWQGFHDLAQALPAAIGGSRQVCDAGHLPRSRQVGASGTLVTARCYLAIGISGAPQHLQGVARCRHIVAVNTDLHAAMVKRADLAIIADAQEVMPELRALAQARRHG